MSVAPGTNNWLYDQDYGNVYLRSDVWEHVPDESYDPDNPFNTGELILTGVKGWHGRVFKYHPFNTWFSAIRPFYTSYEWYETYRPDQIENGYVISDPYIILGRRFAEVNTDWAPGEYLWYKIPGGLEDPSLPLSCKRQLAFVSPETRRQSTVDYYIWEDHEEGEDLDDEPINHHITWYWGEREVRAGTIYILTDPGDPPRWGDGTEFVLLGSYCANINQDLYGQVETTRTQSWAMDAAVQADRSRSFQTDAMAALTKSEEFGAVAVCHGDRAEPFGATAVCRGDTEKAFWARSIVRGERLVELETIAALANDFNEGFDVISAVAGDASAPVTVCAAVRGEQQVSFQTVACAVLDRTDAIKLEMENLWPQEYANESVPNWPSKARHWGREPLV